MTKRRVVITGMGIVSPVGNDVSSAWHSIRNGISGISNITKFDASSVETKIAAEIKSFTTVGYIDDKMSRRVDAFIRYGLVAGVQAVRDSGICDSDFDASRVGVILGSGIGGLSSIQDTAWNVKSAGFRKISPFFITASLTNMLAGNLSIMYGFQGLNYSISSACASSNHSIGDALNFIRLGHCDVIFAGGAEAAICELGIGGFNACKALSTNNDVPSQASCPWDVKRDGFIMGEGAAVLALEEYQHAISRGATIYAELVGYGTSSDAYHITTPTITGPVSSMRFAIRDAEIAHSDVGYINAHGTSTQIGDLNETIALKECFGDYAKQLAISSTKSMTGHLLGAAGAIEAVFTIKALEDQVIPPTINLHDPDPQCDLDYTPNIAVKKEFDIAMSNSFGFGGANATLVFKRFKG